MNSIKSSRYNNLFFTYLLSEGVSKGTIILLDGLPSNPSSKNQLMEKLKEFHYDVFFPRYEGTWESKGEFLNRAPSETIIEFIEALKKGLDIENRKNNSNKMFILGSSFGGGVALDIASKKEININRICAASTVINFKRVNKIETLGNYLETSCTKDYRFDSEDWKKLINNEIWNLENNKILNPSNIIIIAGKNDDQIKERDIINFGERNKIKVQVYNSGHITLSKISDEMLNEIVNFFS